MANLTTEQYLKRLKEKFNELKLGTAIQIAAQDTHVKMVERIFEKGETARI